jgi:hypothetical protein
MGHHGGCLFVPDINEFDAVLMKAVVYPIDMPTGKGKNRPDFLHLFQVLCHHMTAV